jgi:hypothetical protein
MALGIYDLVNFKNYRCEPQTGKTLKDLSDWLVEKNIHHVFSSGGLLQWQIMFYSREQVTARFTGAIDRYPEYIKRVNQALDEGKKTALIQYYNYLPLEQTPNKVVVATAYLVELNVPRDTLIKHGFDLTKNSH